MSFPLNWLSVDLMSGLAGDENTFAVFSPSMCLRLIDIGIPLRAESLDTVLPVNVPWTYLRFTKDALFHTGLRGLSRLRTLRQLSLATLDRPLAPEDFEEVARLPELEELRINWNAVGWTDTVLPSVTSLRLNRFTGTEDLSRIPALFPALRAVTVVLASETVEVPEQALAYFPCAPTVIKSHSVV